MLKKILNKNERKIYDYTIRPLIIYSLGIGIIITIGASLGTLSDDYINGCICAWILYSVVNIFNIGVIELQKGDRI